MEDSDYIVSDEEISTKKERHSRLGEDNLDDTLEYDFFGPPLRVKELKEFQIKDDGLQLDKANNHELKVQTNAVPIMNSVIPLVSRSQECGTSSPCISCLNAADNPATNDSVEDKAE
ncbi:uncharacterized protein LOC144587746 [Pogona vitticeps]